MKKLFYLMVFVTSSCLGGQIYTPEQTHETTTGWRLNVGDVTMLTPEFIHDLGVRLDKIDDCIVDHGYNRFSRGSWVFKFNEQKCFSQCNPDEEFLCLAGHQPFCDKKAKAIGKYEEWKHCPCRYRTTINYLYNYIIIPIRSVDQYDPYNTWVLKTEVSQLNLWDMLRAHVGGDWHKKSIANCVGGCE